ncbi:methionyl-tRNA formyltransferase [Deinobacterium chartae]|uniref:Methionyl-tRNA formyltransferase n=1 Tax=Deinobacterium chartae TaxID=521158 RepID=A0A841I2T2_9DEIO|nr:methionyl-tRNA formyltransferase [Deinobacterium chartae]MBB6098225.1 methionyl-tRNA formyltransferase [Deinobacterium chartae]
MSQRRKVAFFGSPAFALPVLEAIRAAHDVVLVVAQPDKPVGRGLKLTPPPVAARAAELGLALAQPARLRGNSEFAEQLRASGAEVAVTCAYGKILPTTLLEVPPHGFLNTHTSLLPKYRGAAPIQRAVMAGERVSGTTIMRTDAGMDTGPIVLQEMLEIDPHWTAHDLAEALSRQASRLIVQALNQLDELTDTPQDHGQATHAPMLEKEEGEIRWQDPARAIYDRYRGTYGWPGAYTFLDGKRLKVLELRPLEERSSAAPGTLLGASERGARVATGQGGVIELLRVQPESKAALEGAAWIRNFQVAPGSRFSSGVASGEAASG